MRTENIRYQLPIHFFDRHPSFFLVKAAMNAPHRCKLRKEGLTGIWHGAIMLTKPIHFLSFQLPKAEQRPLRTSELVT
jgi:hypothetical protein